MTEPRIFQGSPLTEVPLAYLRQRGTDDRIDRDRATEIVPGVFVQVTCWGDQMMPDGHVSGGAQIAVWSETPESLGWVVVEYKPGETIPTDLSSTVLQTDNAGACWERDLRADETRDGTRWMVCEVAAPKEEDQ